MTDEVALLDVHASARFALVSLRGKVSAHVVQGVLRLLKFFLAH